MTDFQELVKEQFFFPDGTYHCKLDPAVTTRVGVQHVNIVSRFDPMVIATKVDAVRRHTDCKITLDIPYIPAARQDRLCDEGEPFTCKVVANFLNSLGVDRIETLEPHSDVLPALIDNIQVYNVEQVMPWDNIFNESNVVFVSPDGGAIKRTSRVVKYLDRQEYTNSMDLDILFADKQRDPVTGKIQRIVVHKHDLNPAFQYVVIDDVGAMCGTFLGLHDEMVAKGAKNIDICLAHVDCNRNGLPDLCEKFDNVYVTNSQSDYCSGGNLTVVDVL